MLEGFTILNEKESKKDECIVTISKTSMNFTMQTVQNFNCPPYVIMGVNPEQSQFGVASTEKNEIALPFCTSEKPQTAVISAGIWRKKIAQMMPEWDLDHFNYKVEGQFNENHTEMIFNLKDAVQRNKRKRLAPKEDEPTSEEGPIEFPVEPDEADGL